MLLRLLSENNPIISMAMQRNRNSLRPLQLFLAGIAHMDCVLRFRGPRSAERAFVGAGVLIHLEIEFEGALAGVSLPAAPVSRSGGNQRYHQTELKG